MMLSAAELQGPAVKMRKEKLPSLSYVCGFWIEMDSLPILPAFWMILGGLCRFYPSLFPIVCAIGMNPMGQGSLSLEHNGAMLLMRSEQPGDLGCSQHSLARSGVLNISQ